MHVTVLSLSLMPRDRTLNAETILESLRPDISQSFTQAQNSTANHKKNFVSLHKLQLAASKVTESVSGGTKLVGERRFEDVWLELLSKVMSVKKGNGSAPDRIVKFVAGYIRFINEKGEGMSLCRPDSQLRAI